MLTVFMDYRSVVHHEFLPEGQTVNKEYYLGIMRRVREAIRQKDRICGQTTCGFCTTITHRRTILSLSVSIWLKSKRIASNNHWIHLIWFPATFSHSVDSRNRSAERVTPPEMRSWKNRRWPWWLYRKPIVKNVSRIGSSAGISALQSMGSTLKGTISIMMNKLVFLILKIKS